MGVRTFASLFSGCGGFDLGFIASGFRSLGGYENDQTAVNAFRSNVCDAIRKVDLTDGIPDESALKGLDVLIAGPPCQGFSTAGKRLVDDARNHLLPLTARLALRVHPKVLVVENVAGALSGAHAYYWSELTGLMRAGGYRTHTLRCHANELGMAQRRHRVLFFAWRTVREISFAYDKSPSNSLRHALVNVEGTPNHTPQRLIRQSRDWYIAKRIKPGQKLSNVRGGEFAVPSWEIPEVFGATTAEERTILELIRRLRRQDRTREYGDADPVSFPRLKKALGPTFIKLINGLVKKGYLRNVGDGVDLVGTFNGKYRRLDWDEVSFAVDTRFGSPRYFLHPSQQRGFTIREAARLQGFPDNFVFDGREIDVYRLIGNAVPSAIAQLSAQIAIRLLRGCS